MASTTTNATVTPNTQETIDAINANMANVLDFQNQAQSAMALWSARISINGKCWNVLEQAIQSLQR